MLVTSVDGFGDMAKTRHTSPCSVCTVVVLRTYHVAACLLRVNNKYIFSPIIKTTFKRKGKKIPRKN